MKSRARPGQTGDADISIDPQSLMRVRSSYRQFMAELESPKGRFDERRQEPTEGRSTARAHGGDAISVIPQVLRIREKVEIQCAG
jgi:hypothetical protein